MKHSVKAVLATSVALMMTAAFGAMPASAAKQDYPQVGKWVPYDDTTVYPAGFACADEVSVHDVGARRVIELSKTQVYWEYKDSSKATFTNTKTKRTWRAGEGGDVLITSVKGDFDTVAVTAQGDNWLQGKGFYGIPWSRGNISFSATNANDPERVTASKFDVTRAEIFVQVCYKLKSVPVPGKNVLPESPAGASAPRAWLVR